MSYKNIVSSIRELSELNIHFSHYVSMALIFMKIQ